MGKQSKAETLPENAAVASAKYVRMGPRKVRRVVDVIRGMKTDDALTTLEFSPWRACAPVSKVLMSAVANAENNKELDPDSLWVSEAYVDEGPSLRRWRPRAQGRAYPVHKRTSHITLVVEERIDEDDEAASRRRARREKAKEEKAKARAAAAAVAEADADTDDEDTSESEKATAKKTAAKKTAEKASKSDDDGDEPAKDEGDDKPAKKAAAKKTAAKKTDADEAESSKDAESSSGDATEGESS